MYKHIKIVVKPHPLNDIIDENSQTNKEIVAEERLAYAAPDLLEALERILREAETMLPTTKFMFAHSAIARAKGLK